MSKPNNIFLIGFMGTGKTTVAKQLAKDLGCDLADVDDLIVANTQSSINDIFKDKDEEYFRKEETKALENLSRKENLVVSCGGGIVLKEENAQLLKKGGVTVLLTASPEIIYDRLKFDSSRPLIKDNINVGFIEQMLNEREEYYNRCADLKVSTDNKTAMEISAEIKDYFKG